MTPARRRLFGAIASGLLLAAAFPRLDHSYLAWAGLVPLLAVIRGLEPRRAARLGWVTGLVFFAVTISWVPATISNFTSVPHVLAVGVLLLMAAAAAYSHALFAFALEALAAGGVSRIAAAPVLWVILEWMRCFVVAEFPWNLLGYSQLRYLDMVQAADLGGIYLISGVLVLANALLASALAAWKGNRPSRRRATVCLVAALACPVLLLGYGKSRRAALDQVPYTGSIRVAVTQGNVAQDQKWDAALAQKIFEDYLRLTTQAASAGAQLVVWPEAALPFYIQHDLRSLELTQLARDKGIDILVGAPGLEDRDGRGAKDYNQAWLVRGDGGVQGPYDKIQLVPFGEYIPLWGLFGLVEIAVESSAEMGRGERHTIFETQKLVRPGRPSGPPAAAADPASRPARFATLICYEGIFPELTRTFALGGADFLVNISNDAWYGDSAAAEQHLFMAAMRSIENRLPLVRSTNTGISAFVTDTGRIGPATRLFEEEMVVEAVLTRDVWSFYREHGDVFLHLCQALGLGMVLFAAVRRRSGAAAH